MPRTKPAPKPAEEELPGTFTQRVTAAPARASDLPPTAHSSAFAMGMAAKPGTKRGERATFDAAAVPIHAGRPLPPPSTGRGAVSAYEQLFARMKVGDSADLPRAKALGFATWAKKQGHRVATRNLNADLAACWLLAVAGSKAGGSTKPTKKATP